MPKKRTTTEIAGKAASKLKAAAARARSDYGIFKRLKEEHAEVTTLLRRIATSSDVEVRRDLYPRLRAELLLHANAEAQEFYAVLDRYRETRDLATDSREEHAEIEELLARLDVTEPDDDDWPELFEELLATVQQHVKEEQRELLPRAQRHIDREEAERLERRYMERKSRRKSAVA